MEEARKNFTHGEINHGASGIARPGDARAELGGKLHRTGLDNFDFRLRSVRRMVRKIGLPEGALPTLAEVSGVLEQSPTFCQGVSLKNRIHYLA